MAPKPVILRFLGDTKGLKKATSKASKMLGGVAAAAKKAAGLGLKAAAVAGVAAVKVFADFDDAMNQSVAIMGNVSDAMREDMSDAAREVAKTTRHSAKDAAESYFFLASAGLDAKQSVAALPQVASFAQAGMFDMATATDLATDAQSALGLSVKDPTKNLENLTRVTDTFVKANTLANTSVEQIAEAMTSGAGASAKIVGKDIEETSAVLAAFADQGTKGAEAGTKFGIVMRDLQTKALKNASAFEKAGVSVFDANGEMRHMADIITDVEGLLGDMSDAEKKSALLGLGFSDKSVKALTTLVGSSDAVREYDKALRDSSGFTEDVAAKQMESFSAQIGLLKDRVIDVGIEIGGKLAPHLMTAMDAVGRFIDVFQGGGDTIAGIGVAIGKIFGHEEDSEFTGKVINGLKTAQAAVQDTADIVKKVFGKISGFVGDVVSAFQDGGDDVESTAGRVSGTLRRLQEMWSSAFTAVRTVTTQVVRAVSALWDRFGDTIMSTLSGVIDGVITGLDGFYQQMSGIFDLITAIFTGKWGDAWDAVQKIAEGALKMLHGIVKIGLAALQGAVEVTLGATADIFKKVTGAIQDVVRSAMRKVFDAVTGFVSDAFWAIAGLPGKIMGLAGNFLSAGASLIGSLIDGFGSAVGNAASAGADIARRIANSMIDTINGVIRQINATVEFTFDPPGPGKFNFDPPDIGPIPRLAQGAVIRQPTLALIGEAGDEAVVPLTKPQRREEVMREAGLSGDESSSGRGPTIIQHITALDPREAARESAREQLWAMKTSGY